MLARDAAEPGPGAHKQKLVVSFAAVQPKPSIEYTRIRAEAIDENRDSLESKAVELDVTQLRESSANPALFPTGTDKRNFTAYSVVAAEGQTRTRLAISSRTIPTRANGFGAARPRIGCAFAAWPTPRAAPAVFRLSWTRWKWPLRLDTPRMLRSVP